MNLKPRSTTLNERALLYKRFIGLEKSASLQTIYYTTSTATYWTFDSLTLSFSTIDSLLVPVNATIKSITDFSSVLQFQSHYFNYTGVV